MSGSLPPGVPLDFYARVTRLVRPRGVALILDASGEPLRRAMAEGVDVLKPSLREFEELTGEEGCDEARLPAVARRLIEDRRCDVLILSLGARGVFWMSASERGRLVAPAVPVKSTVGAGDSMVAGIVLSLARAHTFDEAIRFGVLIDTYDTAAGAHKAAMVGREMEARGERLGAVRLDSGDMLALSREVRSILDTAGLSYVRIFASGGLDEDEIDRLLREAAPIDAFGVGTRMNVSADAPYLDMAYKLVRYGARDVLKLSAGKTTWTGTKQVYRLSNAKGGFEGDLIALDGEPPPSPTAIPLLRTVMRDGALVGPPLSLEAIRAHCAAEVASLPDAQRRVHDAERYPVRYSHRLVELQHRVEAEVEASEVAESRTVTQT